MADTFLIPLLVFGAALFLLLAAYLNASALAQRRRVVEKIRRMGSAPGAEEAAAGGGQAAGGVRGELVRLAAAIGSRFHRTTGAESLGRLQVRFLQAGIRSRHAAPAYYGWKILLAALLPAVLALAGSAFPLDVPAVQVTLALAAAAVAGFYLPDIALSVMSSARRERISLGFPDALDLMVVCVEAGMGLDATISRVGEEMRLRNRTIAEELRLVSLELRAGKPRGDALHHLGLRSGLEDVKSLVSLLVQTDRFGTSLAQALRVHSESMRTRRYQRAEERAARLPVKLIFPLALFILPSLFVTILGPAAIRIYRTLIMKSP